MSAIKVDKKIVKYRVQKPEDKAREQQKEKERDEVVRTRDGREAKVIRMLELLVHPEMLIGSTRSEERRVGKEWRSRWGTEHRRANSRWTRKPGVDSSEQP